MWYYPNVWRTVNIRQPEWNKYSNKNQGRHNFQIDLAIALINYAIEMEWDGESEWLDWMRQVKLCLAIVRSVISV